MISGGNTSNRLKPWKKKCEFVKTDVIGKLHLVLSDGVYRYAESYAKNTKSDSQFGGI